LSHRYYPRWRGRERNAKRNGGRAEAERAEQSHRRHACGVPRRSGYLLSGQFTYIYICSIRILGSAPVFGSISDRFAPAFGSVCGLICPCSWVYFIMACLVSLLGSCTSGIFGGYLDSGLIAHNWMERLSYSGVNLGWGWGGVTPVRKRSRLSYVVLFCFVKRMMTMMMMMMIP
jgi:hypothetical protein